MQDNPNCMEKNNATQKLSVMSHFLHNNAETYRSYRLITRFSLLYTQFEQVPYNCAMHVSLVMKNFQIHELENHCFSTEAPPNKKKIMHQKLSFKIRDYLKFKSLISNLGSRISLLGFRIHERPLPIQVKGMTHSVLFVLFVSFW